MTVLAEQWSTHGQKQEVLQALRNDSTFPNLKQPHLKGIIGTRKRFMAIQVVAKLQTAIAEAKAFFEKADDGLRPQLFQELVA